MLLICEGILAVLLIDAMVMSLPEADRKNAVIAFKEKRDSERAAKIEMRKAIRKKVSLLTVEEIDMILAARNKAPQ